jgi:putative membrane protein
MHWKLIMLSVVLLVLVIFAVQNYEVVSIQFLFWSFQTSMTIILFGAFIVGVLVGLMAILVKGKQSPVKTINKGN